MPNKSHESPQQTKIPLQGGRSDVGKDTDNDGRVVQPGHVAGEVDGDRQHKSEGYIGKDTDGDGRVVKPGRRPGEIDGDKQKKKH
jgi:hypothetical protein